jgi:hypothetical protein
MLTYWLSANQEVQSNEALITRHEGKSSTARSKTIKQSFHVLLFSSVNYNYAIISKLFSVTGYEVTIIFDSDEVI